MVQKLTLLALFACNGDKQKDSDTGDTDTQTGPPSFTFKTNVRAQRYDAELPQSVIEAHQVSSALLTGLSVVAADPKVQDRLASNGEGGVSQLRAGSLDCWERPAFPMFSFTLDYTNCAEYTMSGGVFVEDHPSGPLLFSFLEFIVDDRIVSGTMSLDTRGAYPEPMFWTMYPTDSSNPGPENPGQMNLTLKTDQGGETLFASDYQGGATVDFLTQELSIWGVLTTGTAEDRITVVHGSSDPADVPPDDPRDAEVLQSPLNWLACRCPTSGVSSYDMPLHFTEVVVDIDDLEDEPDDVDDPELVIPVDFDLEGRGNLTHVGCGEYDVEYDAPPAQISISADRLLGVITFQCETLAINDRQRCEALSNAARALDALIVEVGPAEASATAADAVLAEFDTTYCRVY